MAASHEEDLVEQPGAVPLVGEAMCRLYKIFPLMLDERLRVLTAAMAEPTNLAALDDWRHLLAIQEVIGIAADPRRIEAAINRSDGGSQESFEDMIRVIQSDDGLTPGPDAS